MPEDNPGSKSPSRIDHAKRRSYALETSGLLIIAVLILLLTIVRYWHNIHWSIR